MPLISCKIGAHRASLTVCIAASVSIASTAASPVAARCVVQRCCSAAGLILRFCSGVASPQLCVGLAPRKVRTAAPRSALVHLAAMHSKAMDRYRISAVLAKVRETELKTGNQL